MWGAQNFLAQNCIFFSPLPFKVSGISKLSTFAESGHEQFSKIVYVSFIFKILSISVGFHEVKTFAIMDELHQEAAFTVF